MKSLAKLAILVQSPIKASKILIHNTYEELIIKL